MFKVIMRVVLLTGLLLVAGCGDDDDPVASGNQNLVGTWRGVQEVCEGVDDSIADKFVTFAADGSGTWVAAGTPSQMSWSVAGQRLTVDLNLGAAGSRSGNYAVEGDRWTWNIEDNGDICIQTYDRQ